MHAEVKMLILRIQQMQFGAIYQGNTKSGSRIGPGRAYTPPL